MTTVDRPTAQGWVADDSTFGARLALVRQHMRWGNVKEAATACGLPVESWRSWERDGRLPQRLVEIAGIIADKTGCDYGWLLAGSRLTGRAPTGQNLPLTPVTRSARVTSTGKPVRRSASRPPVSTRRDPVRPVSAIPADHRRPQPMRSAERRRAA